MGFQRVALGGLALTLTTCLSAPPANSTSCQSAGSVAFGRTHGLETPGYGSGLGVRTWGRLGASGEPTSPHWPILGPEGGSIVLALSVAVSTDASFVTTPELRVLSWGPDASDVLGRSTGGAASMDPSPVLTQTGEPISARDLSAGAQHVLARDDSGRVWAWGANAAGQLGTGNAAASAARAERVLGLDGASELAGVAQVAAGAEHSLALLEDGRVVAWGSGSHGQCGPLALNGVDRPVLVTDAGGLTPLREVVAIAAGDFHSLAVTSDGRLHAWGANESGQLGTGDTQDWPAPRLVLEGDGINSWVLEGVETAAAGARHSVALIDDDTARAWGHGELGQLGNGSFASAMTARTVLGLDGLQPLERVLRVAAGGDVSIATAIATTLWEPRLHLWGDGRDGQLGTGRREPSALAIVPPSAPSPEPSAIDQRPGARPLSLLVWNRRLYVESEEHGTHRTLVRVGSLASLRGPGPDDVAVGTSLDCSGSACDGMSYVGLPAQDAYVLALSSCNLPSSRGRDAFGRERDPASVDPDGDRDFRHAAYDNCPWTWNPDQADSDGNGRGDACDPRPEAPDATTFLGPSAVTSAGGDALRLRGEGLQLVEGVRIQSEDGSLSAESCRVRRVSSSEVSLSLPEIAGITAPTVMRLVAHGEGAEDPTSPRSETGVELVYYPAPEPLSVSGPDGRAIAMAGEMVDLTGLWLAPRDLALPKTLELVSSGSLPGAVAGAARQAVPFEVVDEQTLRFEAPSLAVEDSFDVVLSWGLQTSCSGLDESILPAALLQADAPRVFAIDPASGPAAGGILVSLTGQFSLPVLQVSIDGVRQPIVSQDLTQVVLELTPAQPGRASVPLEVTLNNTVGSRSYPGLFSYE